MIYLVQKNSYKQKIFLLLINILFYLILKALNIKILFWCYKNGLLFRMKLFIKLILFETNKIRNINLFQFYHFRQTFFKRPHKISIINCFTWICPAQLLCFSYYFLKFTNCFFQTIDFIFKIFDTLRSFFKNVHIIFLIFQI